MKAANAAISDDDNDDNHDDDDDDADDDGMLSFVVSPHRRLRPIQPMNVDSTLIDRAACVY